MRILVDSHSYIWAKLNDRRLSKRAASIIRSDDHELFFSYASLWEISIKIRLGRLRTVTSSVAFLHDSLIEDNVTLLPVRYEDILATEHLDHHHGDPFDRMLVAQAINRGLTMLTNDTEIKNYPVKTLW
ncbi:MAG TPA: type II toxin-antitoxin system VapC family toxin [Bryocella sp.]|nr:type II toxin-antitoxin system VapC family toxin [Bryocella sp.]